MLSPICALLSGLGVQQSAAEKQCRDVSNAVLSRCIHVVQRKKLYVCLNYLGLIT